MSNKDLPISFRLSGIKELEFAVIKEAYNADLKGNQDENGISITSSFGLDTNRNTICIVDFSFTQNKIPFIKLKVLCWFSLDKVSLDKIVDNENRSVTFPKGFCNHLVALILSTIRGILFEKLKETEFSSLIVPIVNVSQITKEDITIEL